MSAAVLGQFGFGYAWLTASPDGALRIIALPNQDNPLTLGLYPVLPLDVWEHAYYLKYHNLRSSYIDNWFHIINWEAVSDRLLSC
nr:Fe-Mn family superoxide dismutase [uncultured Sellimonas sp.]